MEKEQKITSKKRLPIANVFKFLTATAILYITRPRSYGAIAILLAVSICAYYFTRRAQWRYLSPLMLSAVLLYTMLLCLPPLWLRWAAKKGSWTYAFNVLEPGHQPNCDVEAALEKYAHIEPTFATETPHWDPVHARCDCRIPVSGQCEKPPEADELPTFTVVTALVDIGRRGRDPCAYFSMIRPNLQRDVRLVVFTESWAVPFIRDVRSRMGLENKTKIIVLTQSSRMAFYPFLDRMQENADRNYLWHWLTGFSSGNPGKTIALYGWVNDQKYDFMAQVVEENFFGTDYFVWIDAGYGHGKEKVPQHFCGCNIAVPGTATLFHLADSTIDLFENGIGKRVWKKEKFLRPNEENRVPLNELSLKRYTAELWYNHDFQEILGTFFGGDAAALSKLFKDYRRVLLYLLDAGHVDHDQTILALVASEKPPYLRYRPSDFHGVDKIC